MQECSDVLHKKVPPEPGETENNSSLPDLEKTIDPHRDSECKNEVSRQNSNGMMNTHSKEVVTRLKRSIAGESKQQRNMSSPAKTKRKRFENKTIEVYKKVLHIEVDEKA